MLDQHGKLIDSINFKSALSYQCFSNVLCVTGG